MRRAGLFLLVLSLFLVVTFTRAQDPVKTDTKHYKLIFENDKVRIIRVSYAPGEKSTMHEHPNSVAVFLSDQNAKFTFPDGKTELVNAKMGDARFTPAGKHLPENVGAKPLDVVVVELK